MLLATHLSKRSQQISKQPPSPHFFFFALRQIYSPTDISDYAITVIELYCEDLIVEVHCIYLKSVLYKPRTCTVAMCVAADFTTVYNVHVCSLSASYLRQLIISYRHPNEDDVRTSDILSFYIIENRLLP